MAQGGYRKPGNPAPISGPGALSQRTDGSPTQSATYMSGMPYGQNTMEQQTAAPMAGRPEMPKMEMPTPLMAATTRPNEPITSGIDSGAGVGSDALMMNQIKQDDQDIVAKYLPSLSSMASMQDTPQSFRAFVSFLQGSL
jgi:hypothetical protein